MNVSCFCAENQEKFDTLNHGDDDDDDADDDDDDDDYDDDIITRSTKNGGL